MSMTLLLCDFLIAMVVFCLFLVTNSKRAACQSSAEMLKPGFYLQQTPRPRYKTQSDNVVEQSSDTFDIKSHYFGLVTPKVLKKF